jgi:hypothetical protein
MARITDPTKFCPRCFGEGCGSCIPPRQHLVARCEWCGGASRGGPCGATFCGLECAAAAFEADGLWHSFATDALQQEASDRAEAVLWRFGDADRDR